MNILFLYTNPYSSTGIPIGLSYLIAVLKQTGHAVSLFETTFYNFNYSHFNITAEMDDVGKKIIKDFKTIVERIDPDLICVSCASVGLNFAQELLRNINKRPKTIFGGVGATVDYMNLMNDKVVDYVCVGFGEECLPGLIECLQKKQFPSEVANLVYKDNGAIKKNTFSQSLDLSKLPLPNWSVFDKRHFERVFNGSVKRWGNFQLTRGCFFNCSYCINDFYHKELGMRVYRFPVEKIISEMKVLSKEYKLDIIRIFDECFGFGNLEYYEKFAQLYEEEVRLPTIIETRPESIKPQFIEILKKINCISVSIGVEAGNQQQREKLLNRIYSNDIVERACRLLRKEKIRVSTYNIIGLPYDTRKEIFETINLNRKCRPDFINVFFFCPFPKTKLREYCLEEDLLTTNAVVDYGEKSVIKNSNLSEDELNGIFRNFNNYVMLPKWLHPLVRRAEKNDKTAMIINRVIDKITTLKTRM